MEQAAAGTGRRGLGLGESIGPATVQQVMDEFEAMVASGAPSHLRPLATGFTPLDQVLNGGMRPGELMIIGGPYGVGKTILAMQIARNVVVQNPHSRVLYICYEHDRTHLMSRLICLESAEQGSGEEALTLRRLSQLAFSPVEASGIISQLRQDPRYAVLMQTIAGYADRFVLAKASGAYTTMREIHGWIDQLLLPEVEQLLVVVDYLQKVPVNRDLLQTEDEVTTVLTQELKDIALSRGIHIIAIAASDRLGLRSKRMRLADLRGSSALQYETDIGIVLNRKYDIVSREHLIYNLSQADAMRAWVVLSVEKNRAGRNAVDMEYALDAAHFRFLSTGEFVRERLVDEKAVLE